jgi:hypothetical protein
LAEQRPGKVTNMMSTLWQCEQMRAGQVYSRMLFGSRGEAETFMRQLQQVQPDAILRLAAVPAEAVWN